MQHLHVLVIATLFFNSPIFAEKMDLPTHDLVIERLNQVTQNLKADDASWAPSMLRLADLLADRSRLKAMQEVEKNCDDCLKSQSDRKDALKKYTTVLPKLSGTERSQALLQMAHLQTSLGQTLAAEKLYKQILREGRKQHQPLFIGISHSLLGDLQFQKSNSKEALKHYQMALKIKETPQTHIIQYRMAWCRLNLGQLTIATRSLESLLQNKKIQDDSFKLDVSRDLATFYARGITGAAEIQRLYELSPEPNKNDNLFYLAGELDRQGKKQQSAQAYLVYLEKSKTDINSLEAKVRLVKIYKDTGEKNRAVATLQEIGKELKDEKCKDRCEEYRLQLRQTLVEWNKEEKQNLSAQLTQSYSLYTDIYPEDFEVALWAAQVATQQKNFAQAYQFYARAAESTQMRANTYKASAEHKKSAEKSLQIALLGAVDAAESSGQISLRRNAYNLYLKHAPKGPKNFEIRYQMAYLFYEEKNFKQASQDFRELAKRDTRHPLAQKSADLALDSLAILKDEETLQQWSLEFAKSFPKQKTQYLTTHRRAVLNQTATHINSKKVSSSDQKKLNLVSTIGSTQNEQIQLYQNRFKVAVALEDFNAAKNAIDALLKMKNLPTPVANETRSNRIWLAELELDFVRAYALTKGLKGPDAALQEFRLGNLAALAGIPSEKHDRKYLKIGRDSASRLLVISRLILRSKNTDRELNQHLPELKRHPEALARLTLVSFGKSKNIKTVETALSVPAVRRSSFGSALENIAGYDKYKATQREISRHRLNTRSDSGLKKTLLARLDLIKKVETQLQLAIAQNSISRQALYLHTLAQENKRLYRDLLGVPAPRSLSRAQKTEYKNLMSQQSQPFLDKGVEIDKRLASLWGEGNWLRDLTETFTTAQSDYRKALAVELTALAGIAPEDVKKNLLSTLQSAPRDSTPARVRQAQADVKKNPFRTANIEKLRKLEENRGNDLMVAHLAARLNQVP